MRSATARDLPRFDEQWSPTALRGRPVLVVGLGSFGGGLGAARWLLDLGAELTVTDLRDAASFGPVIDELRERGARLVLGRHDEADLERCCCVVASPAVPAGAAFLQRAARRGVPVETEISLLARMIPCPWAGITGTNGKSTTVALAARALRTRFDRVHEGGNIGGSLLDQVAGWTARDRVVLELSSFQLEHLGAVGLGPDIAVLTNLSPDHLDRHGSMERYADAKRGILRRARKAVLPADEPRMEHWVREFAGELHRFSARRCADAPQYYLEDQAWVAEAPDGSRIVAGCPRFSLPGEHNRVNLLTAAATAVAFGAAFEDAVGSGGGARPLRSRMETIATVAGVRFVDDGVATSPEAVLAALTSLDSTTHLLIGGYDKGLDPSAVLEEVTRRGVRTYLFGDVAENLGDRLQGCPDRQARQNGAVVLQCGDLPGAFAAAARSASPGEVVLFSPGFASYDQFTNFTERVELFRSLVRGWRDLQSGSSRAGPHLPPQGA